MDQLTVVNNTALISKLSGVSSKYDDNSQVGG